jgi:hypothetical protein
MRELLKPGRKFVAALWRAMPRLWMEPAPQLRAASHGIQLSLRPSRLVRHLGRLFMLLVLGYVAELLLRGQWVMAAGAAVLAALCLWSFRRGRAVLARRLLIGSDGRVHLLDVAGELIPATIHQSSVRLGPWVLLVLHEQAGVHRLLLGPDNLEAGQLAALRRRLTAVDQRLGGTR